jgi:hypothetical protein
LFSLSLHGGRREGGWGEVSGFTTKAQSAWPNADHGNRKAGMREGKKLSVTTLSRASPLRIIKCQERTQTAASRIK